MTETALPTSLFMNCECIPINYEWKPYYDSLLTKSYGREYRDLISLCHVNGILDKLDPTSILRGEFREHLFETLRNSRDERIYTLAQLIVPDSSSLQQVWVKMYNYSFCSPNKRVNCNIILLLHSERILNYADPSSVLRGEFVEDVMFKLRQNMDATDDVQLKNFIDKIFTHVQLIINDPFYNWFDGWY
jgi:hypothetical protein